MRLAWMQGRLAVAVMAASVMLGAPPLLAQEDSLRVEARAAVVYGTALAGFGERVDDAMGVEFGLRLSRGSELAWRVAAGAMLYGHDAERACVTTSLGCRVRLGVVTTNSIWALETGPEVGVVAGPLALRGHLVAGASWMVTNTGLTGDYDPLPILNTQELADGGLLWGGGVGASYALRKFAAPGVALEFALQYRQHGLRRYLVEGGVAETTTGVPLDVQRSNVSLLSWRLGAAVQMPRSRR